MINYNQEKRNRTIMLAKLQLWHEDKLIATCELRSYVTNAWVHTKLKPTGLSIEDCKMVVDKDGTRIRIHSFDDIIVP